MISMQEAAEAIRDRPEFSAREVDGVVSYDYAIATPFSFVPSESEIASLGLEAAQRRAWTRRNLRGISFAAETGKLLSLPLHKFFNLNETPSTSFDRLSGLGARIYEKVDGSMIHFFRDALGQLVAATCRGHRTPQAVAAMGLAEARPHLMDRIAASVDSGLTPVFEMVAPWNQIVVFYEQPRLVYLVSRGRSDGCYSHEDGYEDRAGSFAFPFCEVLGHCSKENFEGFVCHLDNGEIIKVKTPWYRKMHRSMESIHKPAHVIYDLALEGAMDDILGSCGEIYRAKLIEVWREVSGDLMSLVARLNSRHCEIMESAFGGTPVSSGDREARKNFASAVRVEDPEWFSEHMALFGGAGVEEMLKRRLKEGYKSRYTEKFHSRVIAQD